jgi:dihydrofolate synthase/folylpolyglutamate synthase
MHTEYKDACDYIEGIVKFTSKNSLSHTRRCLEKLGRPDRDFRSIHVAGTNGKGSVCAFLSEILKEAGIRCGLFTSPHLVTMKERFRIDGEEITEQEFCSAFYRVRDISREMENEGENHPTYFEFLFLMSMVIFSDRKVKTAVLETGLGGRKDATSAIEYPYECIITKIGLDHTEYLGTTTAEIAGEKAGILCGGVPVIYDASVPEASQVIAERAKKMHSPAFPVSPDMYKILRNTRSGIDFSISGSYDEGAHLSISSPAPYQVRNASLAYFAALKLRENSPEVFSGLTGDVIAKGIGKTAWEGRMEEVRPGVYADGAHNADGIGSFIEAAQVLSEGREMDLLFSAVTDKDIETMIRMLAERLPLKNVTTAEIPGKRKAAASGLSFIFRENGVGNVTTVPEITKAFEYASGRKENRLLFCVGSLYLVGGIKAYLRSTK